MATLAHFLINETKSVSSLSRLLQKLSLHKYSNGLLEFFGFILVVEFLISIHSMEIAAWRDFCLNGTSIGIGCQKAYLNKEFQIPYSGIFFKGTCLSLRIVSVSKKTE